jgi:hypothetical protein
MTLRFKKSIKLAPGIRWNLSNSSSSWTLGPRGASVGIGKRGTFLNSGIPGTGFTSRTRMTGSNDASRSRTERSAAASTTVSMTCAVTDDGTLLFTGKDGSEIPENLVEVAKKQNRAAIVSLIEQKCDEINDQIEALGRLHHDTPEPRPPKFLAPVFALHKPEIPVLRNYGWLDRLFSSRRRKIESENAATTLRFQDANASWNASKSEFAEKIAERKLFLESLIYKDTSAMEDFLEENLCDIVWPRETTVNFEILSEGKRVALDVDLPDLEDMPSKLAAVPARGLKLSIKELGPTKVQKLYAEHVHGIVFRLVGEVFASLPIVDEVVVAGYSQRNDTATAQMKDDYLLSVCVKRHDWSEIDFSHVSKLEVAEALTRFDLRRNMLKSGALKSIQPHNAHSDKV